jgi:hypothetical protein
MAWKIWNSNLGSFKKGFLKNESFFNCFYWSSFEAIITCGASFGRYFRVLQPIWIFFFNSNFENRMLFLKNPEVYKKSLRLLQLWISHMKRCIIWKVQQSTTIKWHNIFEIQILELLKFDFSKIWVVF